jgi:hypothetical protein
MVVSSIPTNKLRKRYESSCIPILTNSATHSQASFLKPQASTHATPRTRPFIPFDSTADSIRSLDVSRQPRTRELCSDRPCKQTAIADVDGRSEATRLG